MPALDSWQSRSPSATPSVLRSHEVPGALSVDLMSPREDRVPLAICANCGESRGRHVFGSCARGGTRYVRAARAEATAVPTSPLRTALAPIETLAANGDQTVALTRALSPSIALALPEGVRPHFETSREFLAAAKADNTKRAYLADGEAYGAWCATCGANPLPRTGNPQVADEIAALVASYLAHCAKDEKLKVATLRRRVAAIAKAYVTLGYHHRASTRASSRRSRGSNTSSELDRTGSRPPTAGSCARSLSRSISPASPVGAIAP